MARKGINKVILVGNLGRDPEINYLPSGSVLTSISIATSESWKDKQSGEKKEKTEWSKVVFFDRLAEIAGKYLKKGSKVYVEGRLQTRKWQDKEGNDLYTTEVIAHEMQMLDSKQSSNQEDSSNQRAATTANNYAAVNSGEIRSPYTNNDDLDDDVPF